MGNSVACDVGIVNYRGFQRLARCLESLYEAEGGSFGQVYVFENGPEEFPDWLLAHFPKVNFFKNEENLGFAKACNQIIARSSAPFICFLNPDTLVTRPFLGQSVSWLTNHPKVAVLGPKIVDPDGRVQGSARGFPSLATAFFGRSSLLTKLLPGNPISKKNIKTIEEGESNEPKKVDWVSGACMIVRREAIDTTGGLDEGFFMYWEDCDWCTRFRKKGWEVFYHPGIGPIEHAAGSCSKSMRLRTLYWFHKSAARLYCKYDDSPMRLGSLVAILGSTLRFMLFLPKTLLPQK